MIEELQKILLSFNGDKLHITFSGKKHLSKSCQHKQFFFYQILTIIQITVISNTNSSVLHIFPHLSHHITAKNSFKLYTFGKSH